MKFGRGSVSTRGFTLLEVTFATGITLVSLVLVAGSLLSVGGVREVGERRHMLAVCLTHCLEEIRGKKPQELAAFEPAPPERLRGDYTCRIEFFDGAGNTVAPEALPEAASPLVRITAETKTTRGRAMSASALAAVMETAP